MADLIKKNGVSGNSWQIGISANKSTITVDGTSIILDKQLSVDTIVEKTAAAGVTIDGVLIKDGLVDGVDISSISTHTQNTDTGTTSQTFALDSDAGAPIKLKNTTGVLELRNDADSAYMDLKVKDLTVTGTTTTVNSTDLSITDNIILLNKDEAGAGVTLGSAGIEIERGSVTNATIIWDESNDVFKAGLVGSEVQLSTISGTETLTNKSIDGDTNTITDLALTSLKTVAGDANKYLKRDGDGIVTSSTIGASDLPSAIDATKLADGSVSNTELQYLNGVTSAIQTQLDSFASVVKSIKVAVGTTTASSTAQIPQNAVIEKVVAKVTTSYDGTTPTLAVTINAVTYLATTDIDLTQTGATIAEPYDTNASASVVTATIAGTSITTGATTVLVYYSIPQV